MPELSLVTTTPAPPMAFPSARPATRYEEPETVSKTLRVHALSVVFATLTGSGLAYGVTMELFQVTEKWGAIAGMAGGLLTFLGTVATLLYTRRQEQEKRHEARRQREDDRYQEGFEAGLKTQQLTDKALIAEFRARIRDLEEKQRQAERPN